MDPAPYRIKSKESGTLVPLLYIQRYDIYTPAQQGIIMASFRMSLQMGHCKSDGT